MADVGGRLVVFFFQAEDGIRDLTVTGVQTCALPILSPGRGAACCAPRLTSPAGPLAVAGTTGPAPNAQPRLDGESNLPTLDRRADERVVRGQRRAVQIGGVHQRREVRGRGDSQ